MGLDGVELVMEFEEAFGVELKDEEVTKTVTPRMVIDLIFSKLKAADERVCRSQRAFYMIRRVLLQRFGLERKAVTPDLRFRDFISKTHEKEVWEQIRAALSPRDWPGLVRPLWLSRLLTGVGFAFFLGATILAVIHQSQGRRLYIEDWVHLTFVGALGGLGLAGAYAIIAAALTQPFCLYIPPDLKSIRDLIPHAITSDRLTGWTREDVAIVVKRLTMEQLGLDESEYTEDSRLVEDLHLD